MRTKDQIMAHLFDDLKTSVTLGEIKHVTDIPLLEALLDIRDILDNRLLEIDRDIDKILVTVKEGK